MSVTISAKVSEALSQQLDSLAQATNRSRSWLIEQAITRYVEEHGWQVQAIREALEDYESGTARLIPHHDVMAEVDALFAEKPR